MTVKRPNQLRVIDVLNEVEHLLHLPIRLDSYVDHTEGSVMRHDLRIGDWVVTEGSQIYAVRQKVAHLLLTGWTGWDIHHCHVTCDLLHDGRHNKRSHCLDYVSEGQLYGLVIHRAELSPLACALAPVPGPLNRVLSSQVMTSSLLGPVLTSLNTIGEPIDKDLWDEFVRMASPLSTTALGLPDDLARSLWEDAVDRIELAHRLIQESEET